MLKCIGIFDEQDNSESCRMRYEMFQDRAIVWQKQFLAGEVYDGRSKR